MATEAKEKERVTPRQMRCRKAKGFEKSGCRKENVKAKSRIVSARRASPTRYDVAGSIKRNEQCASLRARVLLTQKKLSSFFHFGQGSLVNPVVDFGSSTSLSYF
jgi:hypothetical protein